MTDTGARSWAVEEFGKAEFGDARLTARLVHMAMACASSPSGRVSDARTRACKGPTTSSRAEHRARV
jgi:hypothetical protein